MIGIVVSPAAYATIGTALPGGVGIKPERALNGDYLVWLEPGCQSASKSDPGSASKIDPCL